MSQEQTHVESILTATVQTLRRLRREQQLPLHALLWGQWGVGKTVAAKKIAKKEPHTFYLKMPDGEISISRLYKIIALSIGSGVRRSAEATLDMLKNHVIIENLEVILIIDEAQRIIKKSHILSELKDMAEDPDLGFSYIFLGDHSIPRLIASHPHSLFERIVIRKELSRLTEGTVAYLIKEYGIQADPAAIFNFAKAKNWTTLDLSIILHSIKKQNTEATPETLEKLAKALGR
ncbi:MAG: ATP-binding protein [Thermodesulfobacterium sp.]|jgi:type II secretory pathway predicted ATPase ExeA|nr:ATP-binding protein [Thermodesulfobacterium sp.]